MVGRPFYELQTNKANENFYFKIFLTQMNESDQTCNLTAADMKRDNHRDGSVVLLITPSGIIPYR